MEEMLIEKVRQRTFLYDTKSPDYRDQHMRANALEGIGKELKIKPEFYVSSRDVRIVCPRLKLMWYVGVCESIHWQFGLWAGWDLSFHLDTRRLTLEK
jgi:hypothetical protein